MPSFDRVIRDNHSFIHWVEPFMGELLGVTEAQLRAHYGLVIFCGCSAMHGDGSLFRQICAEQRRVEDNIEEARALHHRTRALWQGHEPMVELPFEQTDERKKRVAVDITGVYLDSVDAMSPEVGQSLAACAF